MSETISAIQATGRRKNATASIRILPGTGKWRVNGGREPMVYFCSEKLVALAAQPMTLTETSAKFDVVARLVGGGVVGQAGALRHALARALIQVDPAFRAVLKSNGCLMRDPRMKERKKYGQPGARKHFQFSKR